MAFSRLRGSLARDISADFLLNLAATFVSTGTMQLLLYPQLALTLGAVDYGLMLTVIGVVNVITLAFGNNLASVRLVRERVYKAAGETGDFQMLLVVSSVVSGGLSALTCAMLEVSLADSFAVVALAITTVLKSYYLVAYRLTVDYKKNLYANIALCLGYVIGSLVLLRMLPWAWAFAFANIVCITYVCRTTDIVVEPWRKTTLVGDTCKTYAHLVGGGLLSNLSTYMDRFVVYPLLGASSVATYAVATYFSKGLTLVFAPMTGVLLTYFTQGKMLVTRKAFLLINACIAAASLGFFVLCMTLGLWVTSVLYPTLFADAEPYIFLATIGTAIGVGSSFNGTVVLAFASPSWQTIIPAVSLVVYLCAVIPLVLQSGLYGAAVALIISNGVRFFANVVIGWIALSGKGDDARS